jgi:hypothetical protein
MIVDVTQKGRLSEICLDLDETKFCKIAEFIEKQAHDNDRNPDEILLAISVNMSSAISVAARACHRNPQDAALFMLTAIMAQVQAVLSRSEEFET